MSDESGSGTCTEGRDVARGGLRVRPELFLALECERLTAGGARFVLAETDAVTIGRGPARAAARQETPGTRTLCLSVPDRWTSGAHAKMQRILARWVLEDAGSKNGTFVNGVAQSRATLADGDVFECGRSFFLFREGVPASDEGNDQSSQAAAPSPCLDTLVASYAGDLRRLERVARSAVSVVLRGETGTGKELLARAVHRLSGRPGDFVAVNCGAIPPNLVESELFGHRKGAFSGATEDRRGLVLAADGGTLFLDEIGDMPLEAQASLLRVLQEREVVPVGATRPTRADLRLVVATHRDLEAMVAAGTLRADLLARVGGFALRLPPLRARREDLGLLIAALLPRLVPDAPEKVALSVEAARAMFRYDWPANVRELEKCLASAAVLAAGGTIQIAHLPEPLRQESPAPLPGRPAEPRELSEADVRQRAELEALLREHRGNISAIAKALGKARMQIQRWVKRFGLDPESFRR